MDIEANKAIGNSLRDLRLKAGLTQADVAKRLGKPQSYVSKIESGERHLRLCELGDYSLAIDSSPREAIDAIFA